MRSLKKVLYIIIILGFTFIVLDFVPVKFAVNKKDAAFSNNTYICRTEPKLIPLIRWTVKKEDNPHIERQLFLKLYGKNPNNVLSRKEFDITKWYKLGSAEQR
jgi:hypothetical protein